jgi:hypothetical protein
MEEIKTPYSFGDCRNLEFQNVVDLILKEKCFQKFKSNMRVEGGKFFFNDKFVDSILPYYEKDFLLVT